MIAKPPARPRVVFAWEWGASSGHLRRIRPLAVELIRQGCEVILVAKEPLRAIEICGGTGVSVLPCPVIGARPPASCHNPTSFAGLAWNLGIHTQGPVSAAIGQWKRLLETVKPTHVVSDFGLLGNLVANTLGIPTARVGIGFGTPPAGNPLANMFDRSISEREVVIAEQVQHLLNQALVEQRLGGSRNANELIDVSGPQLISSIAEFDPYRSHRSPDDYLGVWFSDQGIPPVWQNSPRRKALAYLKPDTGIETICEQLSKIEMDILLVWNDLSGKYDALRAMPHIQLADDIVDLERCRNQASAIICNGNHGIANRALSLGIPVVMFPLSIEGRWNAEVVERLGFGVSLSGVPAARWHQRVGALLDSVQVRQRLPDFAADLRHRNHGSLDRATETLSRWIG